KPITKPTAPRAQVSYADFDSYIALPIIIPPIAINKVIGNEKSVAKIRDNKLATINIISAGCQLYFAVYKINGIGKAKNVKVPNKGINAVIKSKIIYAAVNKAASVILFDFPIVPPLFLNR